MAESLRILILEDNPADAELVQFELEEAGILFTPKVVMTADAFLQAIHDFCPDLILSDYDLPSYNGALALAEARERCPDTPFILVTGAVSEDRAIEILTQGAKDYVLKTRLRQKLIPAVRRALAEAEEHRARKQAEEALRESHRTLEERVRARTSELEAEMVARRKVEEDLRESERRERERAEELSTILDAMPTPVILVHDPDSAHMTGNRLADELLQQQRGSETSLSAPPEIKPVHFKAFKDGRELRLDELPAQRAAHGEQVKDFEFSLVFNDGTTRELLGYGTPLLDKQQRPRGAVHVLVDITERKRAEDALKLNAAIMENVAEGIFLIGLDDNIIKWTNRKFEQLFGYGPGEMIGMHVDKVNAPTERTPAETRISIVDVLRQTGEWHGEVENIKKDGTHFWCHIHVSLFNHPEFGNVMVSAHTDITQRKMAEEVLRQSEERFRVAQEMSLDAFTIMEAVRDGNGCIVDFKWTYVNPKAGQILRHPPAELVGKCRLDVLPVSKANTDLFDRYVHVVETGEPHDYDLFYESEGISGWFRNMTVKLGDGVAISFRDITERKMAEEALREHSVFFDSLGVMRGIVEVIAEDDVRHIIDNAATAGFIGLTPEAMKNKKGSELGEPRDTLRMWVNHYIESWQTGKPVTFDYQDKRGDIDAVLKATVNYAGTGADGHPRFTYVVQEITDRKKVEDGLQKAKTDLEDRVKEQTVKLDAASLYARNLIEASLDPLITISADGKIMDVNYASEEVTGFNRLQLIGRDFSDYFTEPEKAQAGYEEAFRNGFVRDYPLELMHRDGHVTPVLYNASVYRDETGKILGVFAAARNITERKRAEEALQKAYGELEKRVEERTFELTKRTLQLEMANKELESFSYSVSHDLRAPLRAIDGYSRMILKQQKDKFDEHTTRIFNQIRENTRMMERLIDDLLALSRFGSEAISLSILNMEDLSREAWEGLKADNPNSPAKLKINPVPPVIGDRSLIRQVLINLFSNAIKYSRIREVPLIEVGGHSTEGENIFYVRDNGIGFDMQYHDKLFGVFQRLHGGSDYEGTGVGLAIVHRIIQRHGGRVWAESELDKGATFYCMLPSKPE